MLPFCAQDKDLTSLGSTNPFVRTYASFEDGSLTRDLIDFEATPGYFVDASDADHSPGKGECCLDGTRTLVLEEMCEWLKGNTSVVYWLNGLAGTGKTAIARTVTDLLREREWNVLSFFCSQTKAELSNPGLIIPTLIIQMAHAFKHDKPGLWSQVDRMFQSNVPLARQKLGLQMRTFIELKTSWVKEMEVVIVIDGLDVCGDEQASQFLSALRMFKHNFSRYSNLKFFITSRSLESSGQQEFLRLQEEGVAIVTSFTLHEVEPEEMQLFLKRGLSESGRNAYQPTKGELNNLSRHVGGFFPYATEAVNFIRGGPQSPRELLNHLLSPPEKIHLDSHYVPILEKVVEELESRASIDLACHVLATISLATQPISPPNIAIFLSAKVEDVRKCLWWFRSLFTLRRDDTIWPIHHSLTAFLAHRCLLGPDGRVYVNPTTLKRQH